MDGPDEQRCSACGQTKPLADFYMQSTNPDHRAYNRPQGRCKLCVRGQTGTYQRANRATASKQQRRWRFERQYGITPEDYDRLLAAQDGRCAICGGPPRGRWKTLVVDHCHTAGRVRGLLCGTCNRAIGYLGDSAEVIRAAIVYLVGAA